MNDTELIDCLRQTLADHRISRSEKRVLRELLEAYKHDSHKLSLIKHHVFEIARGEMISPGEKEVTDWLEDVLKLLEPAQQATQVRSEAFFSSQDDCAHKIVSTINFAKSRIDICVFTITDNRISDALLAAMRRKVLIRIVTDDEKAMDTGSDIARMRKAGIEVRTDADSSHMHHKYAIFDGQKLMTGSYNWTRSASSHNKENFIVTNDPSWSEIFNSISSKFGLAMRIERVTLK